MHAVRAAGKTVQPWQRMLNPRRWSRGSDRDPRHLGLLPRLRGRARRRRRDRRRGAGRALHAQEARRRASPSTPIDYCLREAGLGAEQLDYVGFYDKPLLKFERLLETYLAYAPRGFASFLKAMPLWLKQKLHLPREMRRALGGAYTKPLRLHRAPRVARGQRVLPVAVRRGGDPHARRRRRVGDGELRRRPRQPHRAHATSCASRTRSGCSTRPSPTTRGFKVNSRRVQADGPGALRRADATSTSSSSS